MSGNREMYGSEIHDAKLILVGDALSLQNEMLVVSNGVSGDLSKMFVDVLEWIYAVQVVAKKRKTVLPMESHTKCTECDLWVKKMDNYRSKLPDNISCVMISETADIAGFTKQHIRDVPHIINEASILIATSFALMDNENVHIYSNRIIDMYKKTTRPSIVHTLVESLMECNTLSKTTYFKMHVLICVCMIKNLFEYEYTNPSLDDDNKKFVNSDERCKIVMMRHLQLGIVLWLSRCCYVRTKNGKTPVKSRASIDDMKIFVDKITKNAHNTAFNNLFVRESEKTRMNAKFLNLLLCMECSTLVNNLELVAFVVVKMWPEVLIFNSVSKSKDYDEKLNVCDDIAAPASVVLGSNLTISGENVLFTLHKNEKYVVTPDVFAEIRMSIDDEVTVNFSYGANMAYDFVHKKVGDTLAKECKTMAVIRYQYMLEEYSNLFLVSEIALLVRITPRVLTNVCKAYHIFQHYNECRYSFDTMLIAFKDKSRTEFVMLHPAIVPYTCEYERNADCIDFLTNMFQTILAGRTNGSTKINFSNFTKIGKLSDKFEAQLPKFKVLVDYNYRLKRELNKVTIDKNEVTYSGNARNVSKPVDEQSDEERFYNKFKVNDTLTFRAQAFVAYMHVNDEEYGIEKSNDKHYYVQSAKQAKERLGQIQAGKSFEHLWTSDIIVSVRKYISDRTWKNLFEIVKTISTTTVPITE
jgi:hypothetical protein